MIWCTNDLDAHIPTFCKRWIFIWGCFFPVSILNQTNDNYNLWHFSDFGIHNARSIFHCAESTSFLGPKIRGIFPSQFIELTSRSLCDFADYARQKSRILGFSKLYYCLGFVFIQSPVLPSYFIRLTVQLLNCMFFYFWILNNF